MAAHKRVVVRLTMKSSNGKTGPIPVSTSTAKTCPDACSLKAAGCYAHAHPLAGRWQEVTEGKFGMSWRAFCDAIAALPAGTLWRHNQAGDLPGTNNHINAPDLARLVAANAGRRGFTFTHKPMTPANARAVAEANADGFTVNLSADTLSEADQLQSSPLPPLSWCSLMSTGSGMT